MPKGICVYLIPIYRKNTSLQSSSFFCDSVRVIRVCLKALMSRPFVMNISSVISVHRKFAEILQSKRARAETEVNPHKQQ